MEIVPADHMAGAQLPDEIVLDEDLPRHTHHRLVKVRENDLFNAAEPAHEKLTLGHGIEKRHSRSKHERIRMRVKAHGRRGKAKLPRTLARFIQKRGMAQVDAVKKAEGQNAVMLQVCSPRKSS